MVVVENEDIVREGNNAVRTERQDTRSRDTDFSSKIDNKTYFAPICGKELASPAQLSTAPEIGCRASTCLLSSSRRYRHALLSGRAVGTLTSGNRIPSGTCDERLGQPDAVSPRNKRHFPLCLR